MHSIHKIPSSRLEELEKKIAKINKRAAKLECEPVRLEIGDKETITVSQGGRLALRMGTKYTYEAVNITLIGETPVLNGWEFIATQLHRPAGNEYISHANDLGDVALDHMFRDRECDHCKKNRIRNATYIVRNVESGQMMQVGSTCLGDFTGYHSPQAAAKAIENIYNLFREVQTWGGNISGRTTKKFFLEEWMAFVAYSIREHGFVSRRKAEEEGGYATADRAKRHILAAENGDDVPAPLDQDYEQARKVITWVRDNLQPESDFDRQLLAIYASDDQDVSEWEMGRATAGFIPMWKAEREARQAETQATQEYFGNVKDKLNLILKVERIGRGFESYGGFWTTPINFTDRQGRHFVWFSTARDLKVEAGKTYCMRGTIKDHSIDKYTGNKQTVLTRCTVQGEAQ